MGDIGTQNQIMIMQKRQLLFKLDTDTVSHGGTKTVRISNPSKSLRDELQDLCHELSNLPPLMDQISDIV